MKSCFLVAGVLLVARALPAAEPYRFGPLGGRLTADDIAAISRVAANAESSPWALFGVYSQVLPEVRYVDAFVRPVLSTSRIRRGSVIHLKCTPVAGAPLCLPWEPHEPPGAYVQVADGEDFKDATVVRRESERPIQVVGKFSDSELMSLVSFIRSGPSQKVRGGMFGMSVSRAYPIMEIRRVDDGSASVILSPDGGGGETATVVRTRHGWEVTDVVGWVA